MAKRLPAERGEIMSYCLHCGVMPSEPHLRICPESDNPSEYVLVDPRPEPLALRRLSPVADGTQTTLERIAAIRAQLHPDPASESAPVVVAEVAEGDRSSAATVALAAPISASGDVGGLPHAI